MNYIDKSKYIQLDNGTYKSTAYDKPENIYMDDYWSSNRAHSTIQQQVGNVVEKNELVKKHLNKAGKKAILEIACAPGILLGHLSGEYRTVGIEVDPRYEFDIKSLSNGSELHFGYFPEVTKEWEGGQFSNIIALDVIEHVEDGLGFLQECHRLLGTNGRCIIQAPIILEDGIMDERAFHFIEHIWIYSLEHISQLANEAGFKVVHVDRYKPMHEQIVLRKV
jgi:2-polyprenyl-3-methyl-5-hydroxy-6-metoxy-1,4-benzoquinol methylase